MAKLMIHDDSDRMETLIGKIIRDEATQLERCEYGSMVVKALGIPDPTRATRDSDLARIDELLAERFHAH